jgi:predicted ArsR family transcriptional regulator
MEITQEENALLKQLIEEYDYPQFDASKHVTAKLLGEKLGVNTRTALYKLEKLRAEGEASREKVKMDDGTVVYGYFIKP